MNRKAEALIHTSVTDCQCSLKFWETKDLPELEKALQIACDNNHKTRAGFIGRRIRALKKEVENENQ